MDNSEEDNYLMLSGLQHFQFCKRQWAIIHIEQQWAENVKTIEGDYIHRKADNPFIREKRGDKLTVRSMRVKSAELGITGTCDVVEFIRDENGVKIYGIEGKYRVYPVEYKRGKPKKHDADLLQLAAQAICLEEMLQCEICYGYFYYDEIKHRTEVPLTPEIKNQVKQIAAEMHEYFKRKYTPKVKTGAFCKSCSLINVCIPDIMNKRSVKSYIDGKLIE